MVECSNVIHNVCDKDNDKHVVFAVTKDVTRQPTLKGNIGIPNPQGNIKLHYASFKMC
jgi:hypothetical protein